MRGKRTPSCAYPQCSGRSAFPASFALTPGGSSPGYQWVHRPEPPAYQQYLLAELAADIHSGHNVRSTVCLEVRAEYLTEGPKVLRPGGDVAFVQKLADASASGGYGPAWAAAAIIGRAHLKLGERVRPVLEALQAASPNRFRGVRHSVGQDPSPAVMVAI